MTTAFVTGRTYSTRSIGDHECIYSATIVARTAKTVTVQMHGRAEDAIRRGVYVYNGVEQFKPFGSYSMCAIIGADDPDLSAVR
jgi:hypothetical protein